MAKLFRLHAFQGLLLILLAALAVQIGGTAYDGAELSTAKVHRAAFSNDPSQAVLLPMRSEAVAAELPDSGPGLTDDPARLRQLARLWGLRGGFALPYRSAVQAHREGLYQTASRPRAPPLS